jgi:hypothetical protein
MLVISGLQVDLCGRGRHLERGGNDRGRPCGEADEASVRGGERARHEREGMSVRSLCRPWLAMGLEQFNSRGGVYLSR